MKAFVSWSGGKDCAFSLYKFLESGAPIEVSCLLNMNRTNGNAHKISERLMYSQAECIGINLVRESVDGDYTSHFHKIVNQLKDSGIKHGIFGDIYLKQHKDWLEKQCETLNITPIFPLWGLDVDIIYKDFIDAGFTTKIISIQNNPSYQFLLGKELSMSLHSKMIQIPNFDVCGENGEFHTFVTDGPIFNTPVQYSIKGEYSDNKIKAITLDTK